MPNIGNSYRVSAQQANVDIGQVNAEYAKEGEYSYFLNNNAYADASGKSIELDAQNATIGTGEDGKSSLDWHFTSDMMGRYFVKFQYSCNTSVSEEINCSLYVNGEIPYDELALFTLPREYSDSNEIEKDKHGNDIRADQEAIEHVTVNYIFDYAKEYSEPLSVNINNGQNDLRFVYPGSDMNVVSVILEPAGNIKSYAEESEQYLDNGYEEYEGELKHIEAETTAYKSTTTIYPISDRSSQLTTPYEAGTISLNTIGGYHWSTLGEYIAWNVNVEKSGLYKISMRARQNTSVGQSSTRMLSVNGTIPFKEAMDITIPFSNKWQIVTLGQDGEDFLFYLHEGENEIRLQASLGEMDGTIREINGCLENLNKIYSKLLVIMGASPDLLRDYRLDALVPDQIAELKMLADRLSACADMVEQYYGKGNTGVALMRTTVRQLEKMNANPDKIPSEFSYFKTNIGSISAWVSKAKLQPLEIDSFDIGNDLSSLPKASAGFFSQLKFKVTEYIYSFLIDYQSIGERESDISQDSEPLTVWIASGRDQAQIVRSLAVKKFTPETGISVRLQLVTTPLLPATVAGIGPDLVIQSNPDVINFAMRKAAHSLSNYPDIDEVTGRFNQSTLIRMRYLDELYGLPETISFPVLFYRTDILKELGIEVPQSWDDVISISSILAKNNMEFGMQADDGGFLLLLKQNGLNVYANDGEYSLLDSADSINVFKFYTNLFTNYGFPLSYNFQNRFRTGEIPIGIASFNFYNELQVAAPELNGLWGMTLLPGVKSEDGTINRTAISDTTACMILESSDQYDQAWEFLKWWTSADVQYSFATEIESVLGPSGRYNSANLEAFSKSAWSNENMKVLQTQMQSLTAIENVPGGYFLSRNLNNAFRAVVYKGKLPTDVMYDYNYKINSELTSKRKEFGLSVR